MNDSRVEEGVRGYLRINRFNKYMLLVLIFAIWGSYLWGYTDIKETAGLYFIGVIINAVLLKMALSSLKRESNSIGFSAENSSIFEIMQKSTADLQNGSPEQRMEFRKMNPSFCARLDATGSMFMYIFIMSGFWVYFLIRAIV